MKALRSTLGAWGGSLRRMVRAIRPQRNLMNYRPLWPSAKVVRTRGAVTQTALVVIWNRWVWELEIGPNAPAVRPASEDVR